jgi:hypothetical protein
MLLGMAVVGAAPAARAGYDGGTQTVNINNITKTATGSMGAAYKSADSNEYIGCISTYDGASYADSAVLCYAEDSSGFTESCAVVGDANYVSALQAMSMDSQITFVWEVISGTPVCVGLEIGTWSWTTPK